MNRERLLSAFCLALLLFWFAIRDARSHAPEISFADLLAASAECPAPRVPDPPPPGAVVTIEPTSLATLVVESRRGWSPSSGEVCQHAAAYHLRDELRSAIVELGNPPDCIPLPEPSGGLFVGVLALAFIGSSRRSG